MASFPDSFDSHSSHPFDNGDNFVGSDLNAGDDDVAFAPDPSQEAPIYGFGSNGGDASEENGVFVESDGPILPPPSEMQDEGSALREWRRQNAIQLEQKEKREKEILSQILEEANQYKVAFLEKRKVTCENNKTNNREKEKLFLSSQEKFHKEADKNYWKAIAELVPNEVPVMEKRRGKKEQEKKPGIVVVQGPKPGKPTDLARMRQILVKLKHTSPTHLMLAPPQAAASTKDGKTGETVNAPPKAVEVAAAPEAVAAA